MTESDPSLVRNAWIDEQMRHSVRRSIAETIRAGIAAGVGTTLSTLTVSILKWLIPLLLVWLRW